MEDDVSGITVTYDPIYTFASPANRDSWLRRLDFTKKGNFAGMVPLVGSRWIVVVGCLPTKRACALEWARAAQQDIGGEIR